MSLRGFNRGRCKALRSDSNYRRITMALWHFIENLLQMNHSIR